MGMVGRRLRFRGDWSPQTSKALSWVEKGPGSLQKDQRAHLGLRDEEGGLEVDSQRGSGILTGGTCWSKESNSTLG